MHLALARLFGRILLHGRPVVYTRITTTCIRTTCNHVVVVYPRDGARTDIKIHQLQNCRAVARHYLEQRRYRTNTPTIKYRWQRIAISLGCKKLSRAGRNECINADNESWYRSIIHSRTSRCFPKRHIPRNSILLLPFYEFYQLKMCRFYCTILVVAYCCEHCCVREGILQFFRRRRRYFKRFLFEK